jgi:hypothetical protein
MFPGPGNPGIGCLNRKGIPVGDAPLTVARKARYNLSLGIWSLFDLVTGTAFGIATQTPELPAVRRFSGFVDPLGVCG